MAPVEEGLNPCLSGCSSSLQIGIVSALFIIIYVILYSLCTSCYSMSDIVSSSHLHREERTNPSLASPQNKLPESQSVEYMAAAKDLSDHIYSLLEAELNEENPYECISELPLQRPSDKAEGENESSSTAMTKPDDNRSVSAFNEPVNKQASELPLTSPHTQSDLHLTSSVVYAAVNWKTKTHKTTKPRIYTDSAVEMSDIAKKALPPIPDKHY